MSVFSDFQRLWAQRFPQSSLSDAWELDVRASLLRHKQKIAELTKELEQETLYVEYLESLLSDVEKFREAGGDPSTVFDAANPTLAVQNQQHLPPNHKPKDNNTLISNETTNQNDKNVKLTSTPSSPPPQQPSSTTTALSPTLKTSLNVNNNLKNSNSNNKTNSSTATSTTTTNNDEVVTKDNVSEKDMALHQCISELSSNLRRCNQLAAAAAVEQQKKINEKNDNDNNDDNYDYHNNGSGGGVGAEDDDNIGVDDIIIRPSSVSGNLTTTVANRTSMTTNKRNGEDKNGSHFVTVIELKESVISPSNLSSGTTTTTSQPQSTTTATTLSSSLSSSTSTVTATTKNSNDDNFGTDKSLSSSKILTTTTTINDDIEKDNIEMMAGSSSSIKDKKDNKFISSQPLAAVLDAKKKVPPRPPPKYIRRAAPVEPPTVPTISQQQQQQQNNKNDTGGSASSSLERNIKPSEILRQKSSDSLDVKLHSTYRRTTPDLSTKHSDLADELGRKVFKAENLDKNRRQPDSAVKRTQSPTGKFITNSSSSPTGSLNNNNNNNNKGTTNTSDSPNGSLGKSSNRTNEIIGSRESLASQGPISERIKSYESISSLSSDSMKIGAVNNNSGGGGGVGGHTAITTTTTNFLDHEPYYDTVPMDNGDGEYVYIQAGGTGTTGSSSSRDDVSNAGSTLPMSSTGSSILHPKSYSSQTSILTEPESPGRSSNYVNIDYFLSQTHEARSSSIDSDGEMDTPALMRAISHDDHHHPNQPSTPKIIRKLSGESSRSKAIRHIITSIITSETLYVECLNKMMQYMKAIRATLTTSQPVISNEEFQTMFFKIDELYTVHTKFLANLKQKLAAQHQEDDGGGGGDIYVGETFRELAGHINLYGAFLHNYGRAIDTVKKCGSNNQQFKEIVSNIILNSQNEQSLSLEDLLHKPVARVQKNALVLGDLLNETPANHPDNTHLRHAQNMIRNFLSEFNVIQTKSMFPSDDKALRRLVKNSFIVELADGHRKLRHLFLFNDVIACAKYKASGRDRFEFELKWFIPLKDICVIEESSFDPKENSPVNILQLKSQACTVRDQILLEDRDEKKRAGDKHRKKLHDLEAQLVLASPNLVFRINNRATNKTMTFFLSSDFERTQWSESITSLQQSCNLPGAQPVNIYELQAWIGACQTLIKTEMGSYLMRNSRDESLLVGDLHLTIQGLTGMDRQSDFYVCVEIDSYGHYFRKAKTKLICRSTSPLWNESFILELEGSQNVRVLLYEDHSPRQILRAKCVIKLSRQWLKETPMNMPLKLTETLTLNSQMRFVPGEVSLRRVPTSKPGALFGAKMHQILKREKRDIPFILSACIREVERRGMCEVGIYRVSGSASDVQRLKKSFETNNYEAEQLLKEVDIHSVTGILKSYLRELPEALFTDLLYPKLFEVFNRFSSVNEQARIEALTEVANELPIANQASIHYILDHLIRIHQQEVENKMSLHNLAMVFGPTLLRPGPQNLKQKDLLESSTVDVMAQAGILYCFLQARIK